MRRRFFTLDVFAGQALAGNPLAVVLDTAGLDGARMQAIAREFNLSETVFVAKDQRTVRIFTPGRELPFAGHPTIGTAVLLGLLDPGLTALVLREGVGPVPCTMRVLGDGHGHASFVVPRLPERVGDLPDAAILAEGLGLATADIGFGNHAPAIWSAGNPFRFVPLRDRAAVTRARPNGEAFERAFGGPNDGFTNAFVYCAEPLDPANRFHARMFAPAVGVPEDPATGSAAASFAGVFVASERPGDGTHDFTIEQGDAMGRPSRIAVSLDVADGRLIPTALNNDTCPVPPAD